MKAILKPLALAAAAVAFAAPATAQETVRWGIPMAFGSGHLRRRVVGQGRGRLQLHGL
jgi:hypothetical protein